MGMSGVLADIFALERQEEDRFTIRPVPSQMERTFGGQIAAQSLRAAQLTVAPGRPVHSLHASFLRTGQPTKPLDLAVRRVRDGRGFSTRHVTASHGDRTIFELTASFHVPEDGEEWQPTGGLDVPGPEELTSYELPAWFGGVPNFDVRPAGPLLLDELFPLRHPFWFRYRDPIEDASLHPCVMAYISDLAVVDSSRAPGSTVSYSTAVSLDHAVWFHRPARADEWLLYSMESVTNHGSRGMARGTMHTLDGTLVASVAQETLIRPAG
ncbi:acyl-CoA thioesterase [Actinocorallia libanotica]|uniref:Acyl-CoA thioesterase II n=1 Tax=Actinocorallia libanotica TaxID=46162 RepID=A0ABP4BLX1_9ACTN